ncbi:hypothetical protein Bbelb_060740 [Branchiostoma belcheri]|nr:hypothetical protein Bbelb_060740 [Branchiostoma belcheri]
MATSSSYQYMLPSPRVYCDTLKGAKSHIRQKVNTHALWVHDVTPIVWSGQQPDAVCMRAKTVHGDTSTRLTHGRNRHVARQPCDVICMSNLFTSRLVNSSPNSQTTQVRFRIQDLHRPDSGSRTTQVRFRIQDLHRSDSGSRAYTGQIPDPGPTQARFRIPGPTQVV